MIKIICLGKIKENYLVDLIHDYKKRIQKYHKLEIIECKDEDALEKEEQSILKQIDPKDFIITFEIDGQELKSEEFAELIDKTFINYSNITFIIGSSLGLSQQIKKISHYHLSFGKVTYPHGLFRGIVLEQIYRAFKILNHESYHK